MTTVLTVGFVSAGILTLTQAVGVIFGANIGTTLTAQVIAFKITDYALLMIGVGFLLTAIGDHARRKQVGALLMGLGMIFLGMELMSQAMRPLRSYQPFFDLLAGMENPFIGILAGALFTALVQSSSATTGIVIVMAGQGLITLPAGIALVLGSNIGTCVTAFLAAVGKSVEARRTGLVHILFNSLGVVCFVGFISPLAELVVAISPTSPGLDGLERNAAETPRQIANAHTVFNVACTVIFLPFAGLFTRLAIRLVPDRPAEAAAAATPERHLDPALLVMPALALEQARREIVGMGERVVAMLTDFLVAFEANDQTRLKAIKRADDEVDAIDAAVATYLVGIAQTDLTEAQSAAQTRLLEISNEIEHIGDVVEKNLVATGRKKAAAELCFGEAAWRELRDFHARVLDDLQQALAAVAADDGGRAADVIANGAELQHLEEACRRDHYRRLLTEQRPAMERNQLYVDCLDYLRRIHGYVERIATHAGPAPTESSSSTDSG